MTEASIKINEWTDAIAQEILSALQKKAPHAPSCSFCGNKNWQLQPGFIYFTLQKQVGTFTLGGPGLPCIALTCTNCGNTQFLNMIVLGLKHLLKKPTGEQKVEQKDG